MRKKVALSAKKKHLNFVLLSEKEHDDLCARFGAAAAADWIEELDLYLGSKGAKYESHYFTILAWARRSDKKKSDKSARQQGDAAEVDRLVENLKLHRTMPAGFPEAQAIRFRALCRVLGSSWPRLHQELQSFVITPEQIKAAYEKLP